MRHLRKPIHIVFLAATLFITGCGSPTPLPTPTPAPSDTPPAKSFATPSPTPSRPPTLTPTPTPAPTSTRSPAPDLVLGDRMRSLVGGFSVQAVQGYSASQTGSSISLGDNEARDPDAPFVQLTLTSFRRAGLEENGYDPQLPLAELAGAFHVDLFVNSGLWSIWEHLKTSEPYAVTLAGRDAWVIDTHTPTPEPESQLHVNAQTIVVELNEEWLMEAVLYLTWPAAIGDEHAKAVRAAWDAVLASLEFFPPVPQDVCTVSTDETYGYTPGFPIRLPVRDDYFPDLPDLDGTVEPTKEPTDPIADYFAVVRGPAGEALAYQHTGTVVVRTEAVEFSADMGLEAYEVDVTVEAYEVIWTGGQTVTLYFDHRSPDARQAPVGFTCGRDFATPMP